jgi:lipopolysaccharide export LptBFGC system permease protein LptF
MIRFLINLGVYFVSALIGIIVADLIFTGFQVEVGISYLIVAGIFALIEACLSPLVGSLTRRKAQAFMGGTGLIATFVALLITSLISGYIDIDGIGTWIGATVVVWLFGAIAAFLLPILVVRRIIKEDD